MGKISFRMLWTFSERKYKNPRLWGEKRKKSTLIKWEKAYKLPDKWFNNKLILNLIKQIDHELSMKNRNYPAVWNNKYISYLENAC